MVSISWASEPLSRAARFTDAVLQAPVAAADDWDLDVADLLPMSSPTKPTAAAALPPAVHQPAVSTVLPYGSQAALQTPPLEPRPAARPQMLLQPGSIGPQVPEAAHYTPQLAYQPALPVAQPPSLFGAAASRCVCL